MRIAAAGSILLISSTAMRDHEAASRRRRRIRLADLDAHEAHLEELRDERGVDLAVALHLLHARSHFFVREPGDGVAEHRFVVGEYRERRVRHAMRLGHASRARGAAVADAALRRPSSGTRRRRSRC